MTLRSLAPFAPLLFAFSCGGPGPEGLLVPSEAPAGIHGLLRDEGEGAFLEHEYEALEAVYDVETMQAPAWTVSGGELETDGARARWHLPEAGVHTIGLRLFLVDGRQLEASWTVTVLARGGPALN